MDFIYDPNLVCYLPLYLLDGSSIQSQDAYGHTCAVTGATWDIAGRLFDGVDDVITVPDAASITDIFDGGGTVISWINATSDGEGNEGHVWRKADTYIQTREEAAGKVKIRLVMTFSVATGIWDTTATQVTNGTPTMVAVTYNADAASNNPIIYINTTALTVGSGLTETGAPSGTRITDSGSDLILGNVVGTTRTFDGIKGEDIFYSRILTPAEIAHIFNQTKWRYQ